MQLRQHEADGHGAEALPAGVAVVVADVDERDEQRADERQRAGDEEAAVDRLERVGLALLRLHGEDAEDRGDDADGASGEREDEAERRVGADRVERGDTEDDRGDEGDLVALEQVGGHAGAVADVVADVVGDGRRVARVVLGDAGLDLADEVGADVGGLGEDAAADAQEQGEQRATEAEADEDDRARVLEAMMIAVAPSRPRPTVNMPATPPVRNATVERLRHAIRSWPPRRCGRCRGWPASCRCSR